MVDFTEPEPNVHLAKAQTQHLIKLPAPTAAVVHPRPGAAAAAAALMEIFKALTEDNCNCRMAFLLLNNNPIGTLLFAV